MTINGSANGPATTGNETASKLPAPGSLAVLEVLHGVHQGVQLPLHKNVYSIGNKPSVDIMLGDEGVAPEHGVVRLSGPWITIEAAGGEIGLGPRHQIPHGHGCRTTLPVELRLGTARLRIARPRAVTRMRRRGQMALRLAAIGGIGCLLLITISRFETDAGTGRLGGLPPAESTGGGGTTHPSTVGAGANRQAAADALHAKLSEMGLADVVTKTDGTRIVASGTIGPEQQLLWSEAQRWFDLTYGTRYVLASTVALREPDSNPKFDLRAVSFSESPYVIAADGQRRYPGSVLDKGWVIKEIVDGRLTLTKNGKELALTF